MRIRFTKQFEKCYDKSPKKVQKAFDSRLLLFEQDPDHPLLHNHQLQGMLLGMRSINVTGDWRALYSEEKNEKELIICFEVLGTHSQLYR